MNKIRFGIAGPGNIARKFAAAAKNLPEEVELIAVASRSLEKAREFSATYGIEHAFGSYEEMAASPLVDCVYVATPHPFHKPVAEIFLRAGKHVICEKPLCVNAREARELADCAREHGVFLMEAMWTTFLPAVRELLATIERGEIGDVLGLTADFCYASSPAEEKKIFRNDMAGGGLLDVGVYTLHFAAMVLGMMIDSVSAEARIVNGVDGHTQVSILYTQGAIASLSSAITVQKPADAVIYGSRGYIRIPAFYTASKFTVVHGTREETFEHPYLGNGFEEEILEVVRCVREGKKESDLHSLERSIAVLEQMDEIRDMIGLSYPMDEE